MWKAYGQFSTGGVWIFNDLAKSKSLNSSTKCTKWYHSQLRTWQSASNMHSWHHSTHTHIIGRFQTTYAAPSNSIVSHGAPIEVPGSLPTTHTWKQMQTKCAKDLCAFAFLSLAHLVAFLTYLSSPSDHSRCKWQSYAPDRSWLFWSWENRIPSITAPCW